MGRVQDTVSAACFCVSVVVRYDHDFVICEQEHGRPLFDHWRGLLFHLEFPMIIGSRLLRLLDLSHGRVSRQQDVDAGVRYIPETVEQLSELFRKVGVSLAISERLDSRLFIRVTNCLDTKPLRPVRRIDNERAADPRIRRHKVDLSLEHFPACGHWQSCDVKLIRGAFRVDKKRVRKMARKGRFSDSFHAVKHDPLSGLNLPSGDFKH